MINILLYLKLFQKNYSMYNNIIIRFLINNLSEEGEKINI